MVGKAEVAGVTDAIRYWQSENDAFMAIQSAVRDALHTDILCDDRWRKLSHARFLGTVLQKFVERLATADSWDKLAEIGEAYPELDGRVGQLKSEYHLLHAELRRLLEQLERVCAADRGACEEAFEALARFVDRIDVYRRREVDLLHDAFEQT